LQLEILEDRTVPSAFANQVVVPTVSPQFLDPNRSVLAARPLAGSGNLSPSAAPTTQQPLNGAQQPVLGSLLVPAGSNTAAPGTTAELAGTIVSPATNNNASTAAASTTSSASLTQLTFSGFALVNNGLGSLPGQVGNPLLITTTPTTGTSTNNLTSSPLGTIGVGTAAVNISTGLRATTNNTGLNPNQLIGSPTGNLTPTGQAGFTSSLILPAGTDSFNASDLRNNRPSPTTQTASTTGGLENPQGESSEPSNPTPPTFLNPTGIGGGIEGGNTLPPTFLNSLGDSGETGVGNTALGFPRVPSIPGLSARQANGNSTRNTALLGFPGTGAEE
jgi:hypothetical protein